MNETLSVVEEAPASTAPAAEPAPAASAGKVGVLLVNLGTPDAADAAAVRTYLREFLTDPRVIENQGTVWKLVLNGIILRFRPRRKARDYAKIWNREKNESPLKTITRSQAEKLANTLGLVGGHIVVDWAMRYGNPSIASRLKELVAQGSERILVVPLYPQYCAATTATVGDEVFRALAGMRYQPALRIAPPYYNDPGYIEALASSTTAALGGLGFTPDVILASFHGVPKAYVDAGDPYYAHCIETIRLLREKLKLDETKLQLTFQSRFGRAKWVEPATDRTVKKLAKSGAKNLAVVTPGFSADCLETLEEIAVENAHIFKKHGGENFAAIPCLNDGTPGMQVISQVVLRELKGWV
ncbi:MAG TPA: ferrochelatase [Xanthobacteraceae bacterium]|nr:ferrochelatase [Xanthobacteraceae bacterium]